MQYALPIVLMALFLGYSLYTMYKRNKGMPDASRMFFERTGYRYADIRDQPLEAHIPYGAQLMKNARKGYRIHMVRPFHGIEIHNVSETKWQGNTHSTSNSWFAPLPQPPRVLIQISEKSLRGFGKGLKEAFSNSERVWNQLYPHEVHSGNPEFDKRFNVYAENPQAAHVVLAAPGLQQMLMQCTEVDIGVYSDQIRFADPVQKNISAAMGGTFGAMAMGSNPSKMMEMSIPVHDHIAQVLATLYQACV